MNTYLGTGFGIALVTFAGILFAAVLALGMVDKDYRKSTWCIPVWLVMIAIYAAGCVQLYGIAYDKAQISKELAALQEQVSREPTKPTFGIGVSVDTRVLGTDRSETAERSLYIQP